MSDIFQYPVGEAAYEPTVVAAANANNVPVPVLNFLLQQESGFNPVAANPNSSATGIAQFTAGTANAYQLDPTDPYASINAAASYLSSLYQQTGSWLSALTSYGTLNPISFPGGTNSTAYQNAVAGAQAAIAASGASGGASSGPSVSPQGAAASTTGNQNGLWSQITSWFSGIVPSFALGVLGLILIAGGLIIFARPVIQQVTGENNHDDTLLGLPTS